MQIVTETLKQTDDRLLLEHIGTVIRYSKITNQINEDLFNKQLINFFKAKENYDKTNAAKFNTYLSTVLKSRMLNFIRDRKHNMVDYKIDTANNELTMGQEYLESIIDRTADVERQYIIKEDLNKIEKIIETLCDRSQYIINMRIDTDMTFQDISDRLDISKQRVNQIYNRELKKIRRRMKM